MILQYKIPVKIENEDPIFLGLSLRQLAIIIIGGGIAYVLFNSLKEKMDVKIAAILPVIIFIITVLIALFKQYEMTFIPFVLSFIRLKVNSKERIWSKTVDSYQPIDIGYVTKRTGKKKQTIDLKSKIDKMNNINDKISKI